MECYAVLASDTTKNFESHLYSMVLTWCTMHACSRIRDILLVRLRATYMSAWSWPRLARLLRYQEVDFYVFDGQLSIFADRGFELDQ